MASKSFEKFIDEIAAMSVLELSDLVKAIEEKFGVSAAAPAMAAMPSAQAVEAPAEKSEYKVTIVSGGDKKIETIKALRKVTTLGLGEAKKAVDEAPTVLGEAIPKAEAEKIKKELEAAGAKVELA